VKSFRPCFAAVREAAMPSSTHAGLPRVIACRCAVREAKVLLLSVFLSMLQQVGRCVRVLEAV